MESNLKNWKERDTPSPCEDHSKPRGVTANPYDCTDLHIGRTEGISDTLNAQKKFIKDNLE